MGTTSARLGIRRMRGIGMSAFYTDGDGVIYHTYPTYGRGPEGTLGVYALLDMAPKGRDRRQAAWVKHHDRYETSADACCAG